MSKKPKILLFDIETAPILAYTWDIWDQNIALNQIKQDWFVQLLPTSRHEEDGIQALRLHQQQAGVSDG